MAHYHLHVRPGAKDKGAEHAQYIERGGRFNSERYGEIGETESGNLPAWAKGSATDFFAAADEHERANGNAYREFELALPVELSDLERGRLVREFVMDQLGERHAYAWAIHEPTGHNPHVHMMFSERIVDGIERGREQFFKRAQPKTPQRGGALKSDRFTNSQGPEEVQALRARWAQLQNAALERAGVAARVDHRSLAAQGIDREAMQHRGPAVSGIEARGKVAAEVSVRREAERVERAAALEQKRAVLEAQVRVVTRQEMAIERVAVRERRELAREVRGAARGLVLPEVEADRREHLGRAQAAAERRRSLPGRVGEKLLEQARALRTRIGEQLGRVRQWVLKRFPEPFKRTPKHTREFGQGLEPTAADLAVLSGRAPSQDEVRRPEPLQPTAGPGPKIPDKARTQAPTRRTWPLGQAPESLFVKPAQAPAAKPPRSAAEQERERLASMSSQELWNLYYDRNPASVARLVEQDPSVGGARQVMEGHQTHG